MEVSKLTISPENLRFTKMDRSRRTRLRKQNIFDLINSKPYGTYIPTAEFARVTALTGAGAHNLVGRLVKKGVLARHEISPRRWFFTVNSDVHVVRPAKSTQVATPAQDSVADGLVKGVTPPPDHPQAGPVGRHGVRAVRHESSAHVHGLRMAAEQRQPARVCCLATAAEGGA